MKMIYPEGTQFIYITESETLPRVGTNILGVEVKSVPRKDYWEQVQSTGLTDIRLALMTFSITPTEGYIYFLHWDDDSDLSLVDSKIIEDSYTDEDFTNSIKTEIQSTKCFNCDWEALTLVIPSGDPYLNAPGLAQRKKQKRSEREGIIWQCPVCDTHLRQAVVKIFQ